MEISLLKSNNVDSVPGNPYWVSITHAVPEAPPLVMDADIQHFDQQAFLFKLRRDIRPEILNYGPDKAFAVTVNGQPVYYGHFHPAKSGVFIVPRPRGKGLVNKEPF